MCVCVCVVISLKKKIFLNSFGHLLKPMYDLVIYMNLFQVNMNSNAL